jgi:hypothetical protein
MRQTSMPTAGFETIISAGEWPKTDALDGVDTGTEYNCKYPAEKW